MTAGAMFNEVDEDGKPVVGPGLYHTLWDTQHGARADAVFCLDLPARKGKLLSVLVLGERGVHHAMVRDTIARALRGRPRAAR